MSLYGALQSGVSGLNANSKAMSIISDNISNVNTIGYKENKALFSTLVTDNTPNKYTAGGVRASAQALITKEGLVQTSSSVTDIAVSGQGMFVVSDLANGGGMRFTRAGSFTPDQNGNLKNGAGFYLQGVPADIDGNFPTNVAGPNVLRTINLASLTGNPTATSSIGIDLNLQASQAVSPGAYVAGDMATRAATGAGGKQPDFERSFEVFDSQGTSRTITFGFVKTAANTWGVEAYSSPAADTTGTDGLIASGTITFDTDGNLAGNTLPASLAVPWAASLGITTPQNIALDLGTVGARDGLGQVDTPSSLIASVVNGNGIGNLTGVEIDNQGVVTAKFSNGTTRNIYKIPLATFPNANGLSASTGNVYAETAGSGPVNIDFTGRGTSGSIVASSLEASTVDLGEQFTNMITTQRAYSASSKIITTADEMLSELINIKR
ncbi:flagellar hook protein FlgE [Zavarzinia sp. CC-PAN008]|uniref:flagellar hook protein FlgE n=1 Tax=Zavarzinia sp. CC-PAN008 TaxID=3243332 RepID=UPI003F742400